MMLCHAGSTCQRTAVQHHKGHLVSKRTEVYSQYIHNAETSDFGSLPELQARTINIADLNN